ncbi:NADP-dependent oxidoreductase [Hymenobacter crusticola]|uniref:NADP-dependent oxidoreductase n=2 Tax=Hymenobacter crusticola TaxID=1770526 RepID=A0A243WGD9_9BACT|nr:NADP-dependent oxidoreductase [Hymenobacter crusticola]
MLQTNVIILKTRPVGLPKVSDFQLTTEEVPALRAGEVLLKAVYISVDPYLRGKMSGTKVPRFEVGQAIASKVIAEVVDSNNDNFSQGEFVSHYLDWKEYQLSDGMGLVKVDATAAPLTTALGVLGITGLSAYFALLDIGQPKVGETLVVSGAAGAVGSIAGQLGKLMGCRVVGLVGTDEKAALITSKFGFDEAINYRTTPDLPAALAAACPQGVDIYFDNVGGPISDAVLASLNPYGRVAACGAIANYNDTEPALSPSMLPLVVYKFLTIRGFLIADYAARFPEGLAQLALWLKQGKLTYAETIVQGFDRLPEAFIGLFAGQNEGKMIVKI